MRSFFRPEMNTSPSTWKPRSPVWSQPSLSSVRGGGGVLGSIRASRSAHGTRSHRRAPPSRSSPSSSMIPSSWPGKVLPHETSSRTCLPSSARRRSRGAGPGSSLVGLAIDLDRPHRPRQPIEGHGERGLGHAVARHQRAGSSQALRREGLDEVAHRLRVDGLGAAPEDTQRGQRPRCPSRRGPYFAARPNAKFGAKVIVPLVLVDGLHPHVRALHEAQIVGMNTTGTSANRARARSR
jgi:hypothetical protein